MNEFREHTFRKNGAAIPGSSGKRRKLDNFRMAVSLGSNWVDMDTGIMYMIQEYSEALHDPKISQDKKPTKIRMIRVKDNADLGYADEWIVQEKMKDPEPDPRY